MAANPGHGFRLVDDLTTIFGATDFIWHLKTFLTSHSLRLPHSYNALFPVFKKFSLFLPKIPQVSDLLDLKDSFRVVLAQRASGCKKRVEALFSTVLATEQSDFVAFCDPNVPLKGLLTSCNKLFWWPTHSLKVFLLHKFVLSSNCQLNFKATREHWPTLSGLPLFAHTLAM